MSHRITPAFPGRSRSTTWISDTCNPLAVGQGIWVTSPSCGFRLDAYYTLALVYWRLGARKTSQTNGLRRVCLSYQEALLHLRRFMWPGSDLTFVYLFIHLLDPQMDGNPYVHLSVCLIRRFFPLRSPQHKGWHLIRSTYFVFFFFFQPSIDNIRKYVYSFIQ